MAVLLILDGLLRMPVVLRLAVLLALGVVLRPAVLLKLAVVVQRACVLLVRGSGGLSASVGRLSLIDPSQAGDCCVLLGVSAGLAAAAAG
jgi:hypothetical protein